VNLHERDVQIERTCGREIKRVMLDTFAQKNSAARERISDLLFEALLRTL
jgi:hypothetical protein